MVYKNVQNIYKGDRSSGDQKATEHVVLYWMVFFTTEYRSKSH